ncbi:MAG TPA: hypothetical protein VHA82_24575 [Ramlibacter sp.]|uniref:hypothetical protein n=1 Tax=Ramlibacter sp. TaxID=1917967 RepID=UPI002CA222AD|nr:hypothetical protein [Ramlibacter sp.]HVZ47006.1 hypothetical protein [Ramlibacter sp.]
MDREAKQIAARIVLIAGAGLSVLATSEAIAAWAGSEGALTLQEVRQCFDGGAASVLRAGAQGEETLVADFEKTFEKQFDNKLPA